jgi:hypothetical protein
LNIVHQSKKKYSMRLFFLTYLLLACTIGTNCAQSSYKGVKQISAFTKGKSDKSPQLEYELFFDKKGNKIKYHHPTYYCTEEWVYDAQDKITKYDVMCGESFGNGTTEYKYNAQTIVATKTAGAYIRTVIDSLDAQKKIISRTQSTKVLDDSYTPSPDLRTVFAYNDKQKLITETIISSAGKEVRTYSYKGDSLQNIMRTMAGKKDTLLLSDFYRDSGRRSSKRYPISESDTKAGFYQEIYQYDEKGRIYTITKNIKSASDCPKPAIPCAIEMIEYSYKGDQLFQIKRSAYSKGDLTGFTITLYANGLERESKGYNAKGELEYIITYKILKW